MVGAKCRRSDAYYNRNRYSWRKNRPRWGLIVGEANKWNNNFWWVIWDGTKTRQLLKKEYAVFEIVVPQVNLELIASQLMEVNDFYIQSVEAGQPLL
jgi:hypothetical protein